MRGEDFSATIAGGSPPGSPPHARGRQIDVSLLKPADGITPACAGKTRTSPYPQPFGNGSPPHARGRRS